jgi:hypothetical protein
MIFGCLKQVGKRKPSRERNALETEIQSMEEQQSALSFAMEEERK